MRWIDGLCVFAVSFGVVFCSVCFVNADEAVSFATSPLWLSSTHVTEGMNVQISTVVMKKDADSAMGTVTFFAAGKTIGSADFSLSNSVGGAVVAVSWVPEKGKHAISAKISKVTISREGKEQTLAVAEELKSTETLTVDPDNDRDGITDPTDQDDDNDGIPDAQEIKDGTNPLVKEVAKAAPAVAGAATTSVSGIVDQATDIAKSTGNSVFETTESLREKGKSYFDAKVAAQGNVASFASTTNSDIMKNPSGILATAKNYVFKAGAFIFGNIYVFYIVLILFAMWILRKIWRRYSLD